MHVGDIDVMIDMQWNVKKIRILGVLAAAKIFQKKILCRMPRRGTRQSNFLKKSRNSLPSA